jgi:hypothetical protein
MGGDVVLDNQRVEPFQKGLTVLLEAPLSPVIRQRGSPATGFVLSQPNRRIITIPEEPIKQLLFRGLLFQAELFAGQFIGHLCRQRKRVERHQARPSRMIRDTRP